jgi:site-specific DNA-methyltransferase (adenine-specific)
MRTEQIGSATLILGDCRTVLPSLTGVDSIVADPPYGMKWDGRVIAGGHNPGLKSSNFGATIIGDDQPFDPAPLLGFDHVILWGANHYAGRLPVGTTLVWIKRMDLGFGSFLSDAEVAFKKGGHGVYCRRDTTLMAETKYRAHPTQKPVGIMEWCVGMTEGLVCDPYMGSCSTGVACMRLGRPFIGIEIDPVHFETSIRRIEEAHRQRDLFVDAPAEPPEEARIRDMFAEPEAL